MQLQIRRREWPLLAAVLFVLFATPVIADDALAPLTSAAAAVPAADPLAELVDEAIRTSSRRRLVADLHTPWQIIHGVLAYRHEFLLRDGDADVPALDWIAKGPSYKGEPWFQKTEHGGRAHPFTKPYIFEGHPNQFLALMSMSKLPTDFRFETKDGPITVDDMVRNAQMDANTKEEITWTLWALSHYLPYDAQWHNKQGEAWSMERLVQIEVRNDVNRAACGGTHGLFALASARDAYLRATGQPLRGVWLAADQKVQQHIQIVRMLQNPDGTFSTNFFAGRGPGRDFDAVLVSSGHTLEFLMRALPDERLNEEWIRRGVGAIARGLVDYRNAPLDCGPLYHAVSGLTLYRERTRPQAPPLLADALEQAAKPVPLPVAPETPNAQPVERRPEPAPTVAARPIEPRPAAPQPADGDGVASSDPPQRGILPRIPLPFTNPLKSRPSSDVPSPIALPAPTANAPRSAPPAADPADEAAPEPPALPAVDVAALERQRREAEAREAARQRQEAEAREAARKRQEEARLAEVNRLRIAAETRRAEADALAAEAAAQRAAAEAQRAAAEAKQAEAAAKQAEAEARRVEASAKQAELEARRAEAEAARQAAKPTEAAERK
ncbi:MAG: hypothetical protein WD069_16060 [Planctomycetales bacterium]